MTIPAPPDAQRPGILDRNLVGANVGVYATQFQVSMPAAAVTAFGTGAIVA